MQPLIAEVKAAEDLYNNAKSAFESSPTDALRYRMENAEKRLRVRQSQYQAQLTAAAKKGIPVAVDEIRSRPTRRFGKVIPGAVADGHKAEIIVGKSVRLFGRETKKRSQPFDYDRTFNVGDIAEYDSFNRAYLGRIIAIGEKTVTIQEEHGDRIHRLDLFDFDWRNFDLDVEATLRRNDQWVD